MDIEKVANNFKVLDIDSDGTPKFTLHQFSQTLAYILMVDDPAPLAKIHVLLSNAPIKWLFPNNDSSAFVEVVRRLSLRSTDPAFVLKGKGRPADGSTVKFVAPALCREILALLVSLFSRIHLDIKNLSETPQKSVVRCTAVEVLSCVALYVSGEIFNDDELVASAKELEEVFVGLNRNCSVTEMLVGWRVEGVCVTDKNIPSSTPLVGNGFMKKMCRHLTQPYLTKEHFSKHLVQQVSFVWLLESVESPSLDGFLDYVFPPTLCFLDSYDNRCKILGIRCLSEILQKIKATSILRQNRHLVVAKTLLHQLNFHDLPLMRVLHPCILIFVERHHLAMKKGLLSCNVSLSPLIGVGPSLYDLKDPTTPKNQFFDKMISLIELESDKNVKRELIRHIGAHIRGMGIVLCRYLKRTINMLTDVLASRDDKNETARLLVLDAICDVIRVVPQRLTKHVVRLGNPLVHIMVEVYEPIYTYSEFTRDNVVEKARVTLSLLAVSAPEDMRKFFTMLPIAFFDARVRKILNDIEKILKKVEERRDC